MKIKITAAIILFPFLLMLSCGSKTPEISSIVPKIGSVGEIVTLHGSHFGDTRDESYITIANVSPTASSYQVWQDNLIKVRIPEGGDSGLVYVHVKGKRSNGVLFSNYAALPRPLDGEDFGLEPRITDVTPQIGVPGTLITITGNNFGVSRETARNIGGVFFSWDYESPANPFAVRDLDFIEVSETEFGYESWNMREIKVRVPDGAVTGNMEVRTAQGISQPVIFDVSGKPGIKTIKDKRSYTITYSVDVRVREASRPNSLYLWMPLPVTSPSQRNVIMISRSAEPFLENHQGISLFKIDNLTANSNHTINLSYNVEVYAVETGLRPVYIRSETTPLHFMYTQGSSLIPSNSPQVRSITNSITTREQNPYLKARVLYDWILSNIKITETASSTGNAASLLDQRTTDSFGAALLYTAMARAAGLPCIPVAGVLVNRSNQTMRHSWAELWIDGFGWLPVDPAMGAGAVPESFVIMQDTANYYFGNLDNQRIAFSRGEIDLSQMDNRGRIVSHPKSYSLQNIWEEAAGGLDSYSSFWGDIVITGVYSE